MSAPDSAGVTVRPIRPDELGLAARWLSDPAKNRWLGSDFRDREITSRTLAIMLRSGRTRLLLVCDDQRPCGLVGFSEIDEGDGLAMIWYVLGADEHRGRGITTAAVRSAVAAAFDEYGWSCVWAWILEDNAPSRRVLEKAGFREVGRMRAAGISGDRRVDRVYFDIVRSDLAPAQNDAPMTSGG